MALQDRPGSLQRARLIAMLWAVIVYSGMLVVGWCGRLLVPSLTDPEVIFITLTNTLFPPVLAGIMLAAVLSAIMSTADSQLLVAASSVTHDLNLGGDSSQSLLRRSRLVVVLLSAGAALGAIFGTQEIFSQVLFAWAAMGCAFGPVLLVTVLIGEVPPRLRLAAIITGCTLSVAAYYGFASDQMWKGSMERVLPFLVALAMAGLGASRLRKLPQIPEPEIGNPEPETRSERTSE
jgi:sodium/proline symporter